MSASQIPARYGVVIPACNEAECIPSVLEELQAVLPLDRFLIAVGVNGSDDETAALARKGGAVVGETDSRGYGHGCRAAIQALERQFGKVEAYVFHAADGASDPQDILRLAKIHEQGCQMVLGMRTTAANRGAMGWSHLLANRLLGLWASLLTGHYFRDLGPLRLISREAYERMGLRETEYGWTIEAQIRAVQLGISIRELPVRERRRLAGAQKVSRVAFSHTVSVGLEILKAGWRTFRTAPTSMSQGGDHLEQKRGEAWRP